MTSVDPEQPAPPAVPAQWAWAQQRPMQTVETEPLEYHRLLRGAPKFRWWKPLLVALIAASLYFILSIVLGLVMGPIIMVADPDYLTDMVSGTGDILDTQRPMSVLLSLLSIILMIPSVLLAMLIMGMRPVGRVWSVATRIRWGLLGRSLGNALVAVIVLNLVGIGVGMLTDPGSSTEEAAAGSGFDANAAIISMVLVVLLVPFQSMAEEVAFRGLFMQVLGSWMRPGAHRGIANPVLRWLVAGLNSHWLAILVPSVLFALAHIYDIWGMLAVGCMGLLAAWLTWRTGGLEAAIAIHVVNNLIAFGFMSAGFGGETAQVEDSGGPATLVGEVVGLGVFLWLTLRSFKKGRYGRTRIDLLLVPAPVQPGTDLDGADVHGAELRGDETGRA